MRDMTPLVLAAASDMAASVTAATTSNLVRADKALLLHAACSEWAALGSEYRHADWRIDLGRDRLAALDDLFARTERLLRDVATVTGDGWSPSADDETAVKADHALR